MQEVERVSRNQLREVSRWKGLPKLAEIGFSEEIRRWHVVYGLQLGGRVMTTDPLDSVPRINRFDFSVRFRFDFTSIF